jgi:hypothetical protein
MDGSNQRAMTALLGKRDAQSRVEAGLIGYKAGMGRGRTAV